MESTPHIILFIAQNNYIIIPHRIIQHQYEVVPMTIKSLFDLVNAT